MHRTETFESVNGIKQNNYFEKFTLKFRSFVSFKAFNLVFHKIFGKKKIGPRITMCLKILNTPLQIMTNIRSLENRASHPPLTCDHWLAINTNKFSKTILKGHERGERHHHFTLSKN